MVLKDVTLQSFASEDLLVLRLHRGVNALKVREHRALSALLLLLLNSKEAPPLPPRAVRADTKVVATVLSGEKLYRVEGLPDEECRSLVLKAYGEDGSDVTKQYLHLSAHVKEHDLSSVFNGKEKRMYPRFLSYAEEEKYYAPRELSARTGGMSDIKAFRAYLNQKIKDFKREAPQKNDGEKLLRRYLCFLKNAEFWSEFEEIRNLHGVKKPLIVENFLENLTVAESIKIAINESKRLNRQTVLFI